MTQADSVHSTPRTNSPIERPAALPRGLPAAAGRYASQMGGAAMSNIITFPRGKVAPNTVRNPSFDYSRPAPQPLAKRSRLSPYRQNWRYTEMAFVELSKVDYAHTDKEIEYIRRGVEAAQLLAKDMTAAAEKLLPKHRRTNSLAMKRKREFKEAMRQRIRISRISGLFRPRDQVRTEAQASADRGVCHRAQREPRVAPRRRGTHLRGISRSMTNEAPAPIDEEAQPAADSGSCEAAEAMTTSPPVHAVGLCHRSADVKLGQSNINRQLLSSRQSRTDPQHWP